MKFQNKFKLTALSVALGMSMATQATTITQTLVDPAQNTNEIKISAYNGYVNVDAEDVKIYVDSNNGGYGSFNVFKGAAGVPGTVALITSDINAYGGTVINTDTTINGNLSVNGTNVGTSLTQIGNNTANISAEAVARAAADTAITAGIAAGVTTGSLNVDVTGLPVGSKSTLVVDGTGTHVDASQKTQTQEYKYDGTTLTYSTVVNKDDLVLDATTGLYVLKDGGSELAYADQFKQEGKEASTAQIYTPNKLEFNSVTTQVDNTRDDNKTATVYYDEEGLFVKVDNVLKGLSETTETDTLVIAEDNIIV